MLTIAYIESAIFNGFNMWWMRDRKSWCFTLSKWIRNKGDGLESGETEGANMFEVPGNSV